MIPENKFLESQLYFYSIDLFLLEEGPGLSNPLYLWLYSASGEEVKKLKSRQTDKPEWPETGDQESLLAF